MTLTNNPEGNAHLVRERPYGKSTENTKEKNTVHLTIYSIII